MKPASDIIRICGGVAEVARLTGRHASRVGRWQQPKEKGGTGGHIPADVQQVLLDSAIAEGKPLLPCHFFLGRGAVCCVQSSASCPPAEETAA
jgi:hypothetical protein